MNICVVHPSVCSESAKELAEAVGGFRWNPYDKASPLYAVDLYFNYGVSDCDFLDNTRIPVINRPMFVRRSVDKIASYNRFRNAGIPTCEYVVNQRDVPRTWDWIVCRETTTGRNCDGVTVTEQENMVRGCPLYTKFFHHDEEHRIVVFNKRVVARYMKMNLKDGEYELVYMQADGYEDLDVTAVKAANSIGLDYAGVDILFNSKNGKHLCLEINSGPALTDEVADYLKRFYKGK